MCFVPIPALGPIPALCGLREKVQEEGISELPDEVLGSIVSLLTLKEAAASFTLSRRWRYVWTQTMNRNFDADSILDNFYTKKTHQILGSLKG